MRCILFLQFAAGFTLAATQIDCGKHIAHWNATTERIQETIPDLIRQIRVRRVLATSMFNTQIELLARKILSKEDDQITPEEWQELGALKDEILDAPPFADYHQYQRLSKEIENRRNAATFDVETIMGGRAKGGYTHLRNEAKARFADVARQARIRPYEGLVKPSFPTRFRFIHFSSVGGSYRACYEIRGDGTIEFIYVGPHENFYDKISDLRKGR